MESTDRATVDPGTPTDVVRVTAVLTRRQATALKRSVPWKRQAVVRWLVWLVATSLLAAPLVVAVSGSVVPAVVLVVIFAAILGHALLAAPWTAPRNRPAAHGIGSPVTWELSAAGVGVASVVGTGFRPWSGVDSVGPRGDLLVVADRRRRWATGVPLGLLPPGAVERVIGWHAAAPAAPAEPDPVARRDGEDLVVVARPSVAQVREPLVGWARALRRSPAVLLLALPVVALLLLGLFSADPVRVLATALVPVGVALVAVIAEVVVRRQAGRARTHGYRIGAQGLSYAVDGAWQHVPWARVTRVTLTPSFLVVAFKDLEGPVALPLAGLPADAPADVARWCAAAGVRVQGHAAPG